MQMAEYLRAVVAERSDKQIKQLQSRIHIVATLVGTQRDELTNHRHSLPVRVHLEHRSNQMMPTCKQITG